MAKAVKVKPVLAWTPVVNGKLWPAWTGLKKGRVQRDMADMEFNATVIRVIIRPAPRRKK